MTTSFSSDYATARSKFVETAAFAKAEMASFRHELLGPRGEELVTDVAWLGPRSAKHVLVTISGVYGVEGFVGSAVQIEWLRRSEQQRLQSDSAVLLIHAMNPYGFAWLRRTNEDNIDLNRNWMDFDKPLPVNAGYEELTPFCR
ncbi:MAG: DUF2817 domain-containing protein [Planctomycetaceae bacterium]|nr:DUF2817 domain-containing protein [Planctomycetaceae bacterium]